MGSLQVSEPELVSVVVPAFNAAETLGETLLSIRRQTHRRLEIVVVNDGSTDDTGRIARAHAAEDDRIRVIDTINNGVAAARNAGIWSAHGALIAPVDADDLWHPEKIARQLEVMRRGGSSMGFVYAGFRSVDMAGRILDSSRFEGCAGRVYLRAIFTNFVGNGSALLVRREALERIGGYSTELQSVGLQGAEDWLAQILMARHWDVGVVPARLVGYRQTPGAMSRSRERMLRSMLMVCDLVQQANPETPDWVLRMARARCWIRLALDHARHLRPAAASVAIVRAAQNSLPGTAAELGEQARQIYRRRWRKLVQRAAGAVRPDFYDVDPDTFFDPPRSGFFGRFTNRLARADQALNGSVKLMAADAEAGRRGIQAAATPRRPANAAALKVLSVRREIGWRWTLK